MNVTELELPGLKLIELKLFQDDRGFFTERFQAERFRAAGLPTEFVQDNFSRSAPRVLRGLHFQWNPAQGKLVGCTRGRIWDVVVDVRKNSPTFGRHVGVELTGDNGRLLWVPAGFAHGFVVLGDEPADVLYKVDALYNAAGETALLWNDPTLAIQWPVADPILSPKDAKANRFEDAVSVLDQTARF